MGEVARALTIGFGLGLVIGVVLAIVCIRDMRRFPSSVREMTSAKRAVAVVFLLVSPVIGALYYFLAVRPFLVKVR